MARGDPPSNIAQCAQGGWPRRCRRGQPIHQLLRPGLYVAATAAGNACDAMRSAVEEVSVARSLSSQDRLAVYVVVESREGANRVGVSWGSGGSAVTGDLTSAGDPYTCTCKGDCTHCSRDQGFPKHRSIPYLNNSLLLRRECSATTKGGQLVLRPPFDAALSSRSSSPG